MNIIQTNHSSAFICTGPHDEVAEFATDYLQQLMCPHRIEHQTTICRCNVCRAITEHQSSTVTWIEPTSDYVLDDIEPILTIIRFQLDDNKKHAFVLANAHLLSTACANRLLKVVEEPPRGYLFIFLANDYAALLPTIQSRCTILYQSPHQVPTLSGLLTFFTDPEKQQDPAGLDTFLRSEQPSLAETKLLVHQLVTVIDYDAYRNPSVAKQVLDTAQRNFPQAGGAQHYLRWLFMALHAARFSD
ncbi:MAG: polymerase subunit delta [Candidatus Dependentiae bacterium]|nr:polymerase subunit delta [Candidatus Dependentiae bacterium]